MNFTALNSLNDLHKRLKGLEQAYVLIYKDGSEKSNCALENIRESGKEDLDVFTVDVSKVKDIHPAYNISTAPSLLVFRDGKLKNVVKGCHDKQYFTSIFENLVRQTASVDGQKSVRVYTTPSCTWCNTLKSYLRQKGVVFEEIDVSRDQQLAEELVRQTGQQGVPQSNIGGEWVVGFNKSRINSLLGIQ